MPYKHIAAHLKKTELACRLHYHQLSHGSNRRKRTNSTSSSSPGSASQSPILPVPVSIPSPVHEAANMRIDSPPTHTYTPQTPAHTLLPSASTLLSRSTSNSPPRNISQPVAILPKSSPPCRPASDATLSHPLRLDCDVVVTPTNISNVDKERLRHIYEIHRAAFWGLIAKEYGGSASPFLLEEAWKRGIVNDGPPTPCTSPDTHTATSYQAYSAQPAPKPVTPAPENKPTSATSISALLGIVSSTSHTFHLELC
jgi:hypothetical protein